MPFLSDSLTAASGLDQLAKPTFRSCYAHIPFATEHITDGHSLIYQWS